MSSQALTVLFPVGRLVQGSLYTAQDKDMDGRPRVYPPGHAKAGQPKITYFFAVALPKTPGAIHWGAETWGAPILAFGRAAWPGGQAERHDFAWKITDGDSATPNKRGRRPCDIEGFRGHWVVGMSSSFPPRIYTRGSDGRAVDLLQPDAVKPGYYIQVQATVASNETSNNPGVYINHGMVMLCGYGTEIRQGPDPSAVQWSTALPPGASATPMGGAMPAAPGDARATPSAPPLPPVVSTPGGAPAPPAPAPTPVVPSPSFISGAPAAVQQQAPPGPQMTLKANGMSYAQFIAAGWADAQLRAQGYLV